MFRDSNMVTGRVTYETFSADISYSPTGSGHFFTLKNLEGKLKSFRGFLNKYEERYTFCIWTLHDEFRQLLLDRDYSLDENNNLRIGIRAESDADRLARRARDAKTLPSGGRYKNKLPRAAKEKVKEQIAARKPMKKYGTKKRSYEFKREAAE